MLQQLDDLHTRAPIHRTPHLPHPRVTPVSAREMTCGMAWNGCGWLFVALDGEGPSYPTSVESSVRAYVDALPGNPPDAGDQGGPIR